METKAKKPDVMKLVAGWIVKTRYVFWLAFVIFGVYCALSVGRVKVSSDLTAFLPEQTETRRGLTVMEDEFVTYASASVMLSNVTCERAGEVAEDIRALPHVADVAFDDSPSHFVSSSAMLSVSFDVPADDPGAAEAMQSVRALTQPFDTYVRQHERYGGQYDLSRRGERRADRASAFGGGAAGHHGHRRGRRAERGHRQRLRQRRRGRLSPCGL